MKWLVAIPAGLGALLGCVVGIIVAGRSAPAAQPRALTTAERTASREASADDEFDEIETLAARIRSLEQKVSLLTAALSAGRGEAPRSATGDDDSGVEVPGGDVADPVFEAAVRDIMDRIDDERRQERTDRGQKRVQSGAQRVSERLTQELGLTDHQRQELFEIFKKHYETLASLRDGDAQDAPATPGEWRERFRQIRSNTEKQLEEALLPAQFEKYQALDASEFTGGPRARRAPRD